MVTAGNTLGFWYFACIDMFGANSPATKYIEGKISESPSGINEKVLADYYQMINLLTGIDRGNKNA